MTETFTQTMETIRLIQYSLKRFTCNRHSIWFQ